MTNQTNLTIAPLSFCGGAYVHPEIQGVWDESGVSIGAYVNMGDKHRFSSSVTRKDRIFADIEEGKAWMLLQAQEDKLKQLTIFI